VTGVELNYAVPADDLADYVTVFYYFRAGVPRFEDTERADHAQLRFRLSPGTGEYQFPDGSIQPAPAVHMVGPTSGATRIRVEGPVEVFGCGITPAGWVALVGADASSLTNRVVHGTDLFGHRASTTLAALDAAAGIDAKRAVAEQFIRVAVGAGENEVARFCRMVDRWLADHISPDLDTLVAQTGLSRRQVERKCNALYGVPPKLLARKYRALKAAVALAAGRADLDDLIAGGFYDQSHFIREVKQFTGHTPRQIAAEPSLLAQLTITRRQALEGQVGPLIHDT
jgi:AraC-like DNA-binding protein